ncbi:ferrochelatase [Dongia sedimenti]|uniref:Ferrochelatase n=1 Tax=Dongia sedimenti TaxID=3064282 RepID=A0ABU0YKZ7_9PROT|nr:ferrochelatase [Rhodospirillaceae bacterium R-7]
MSSNRRIAIVLFNLGGPDSPAAVEPFLFNLFNDRNIIDLPGVLRWPLAKLISSRRAKAAGAIYAEMGGRSPILPNTERQAAALQASLGDLGEVKVFIAMRYWHPLTEETVAAVKRFAPDEVILLPLYPQFSTTTTESSDRVWRVAAKRQGLTAPRKLICCYPTEPGFIAGVAKVTAAAIARAKAKTKAPIFVIFSAHGLPKKIVDRGDPYVAQVSATVHAVVDTLGLAVPEWMVAFQSRVGPLEWVGPPTDHSIEEAASAGKAVVVVPIAFVSEHSETLVELDIEYRHLAEKRGAAAYERAPTVSEEPDFIAGLAQLVRTALQQPQRVQPGSGAQYCAAWPRCACQREEL